MEALLGYYVHQLDPFIFRITDTFGPRWYGLAYLLGFLAAILFLRYLAQRGIGELPDEKVTDFIVYTAIFGVMIGGRLGYFMLYRPGEFFSNPLVFFKLMDGGMASHGGILGVVLFALYYARRHGHSWAGLGDDIVVVAPIGIFFGRIANFINGELYGRATDVRWAVQFPDELLASPEHGLPRGTITQTIHDTMALVPEMTIGYPHDVVLAAQSHPQVVELLSNVLTPRHPSQLYEAILEGLLITLILAPIRLCWKRMPKGFLTGLFFLLYPLFRMIGEQYREPDAETIMGLTRGQFYSTFMILVGLAFLTFASSSRSTTQPVTPKDA
jgi:phosphatidylglycerol:prolipoprotein diacylglycerol transferase